MVRPSNLRTELLEFKKRAAQSNLLHNIGVHKLSSLGNQGLLPKNHHIVHVEQQKTVQEEKKAVERKIKYLDDLLKELKNRKHRELTDSAVPKDIENPYIQNLLKMGNMSQDILSRARHDPRDNPHRLMLEKWVKNKKMIKKKIEQDLANKLTFQDKQERMRQIFLARKNLRDKNLSDMNEREKHIWNERKLKMEAEFGKDALKNLDSQLQKMNGIIADNASASKEAKELLDKFIRATNVFEKLRKLENDREARRKYYEKKMRKKEIALAAVAKKQQEKLKQKLKVMGAQNRAEAQKLRVEFKKIWIKKWHKL